MTSSTAWRSGVPGAIFSIACSSCGSRRGASSEGVLVKPSSSLSRSTLAWSLDGIEACLDRFAQRLCLRNPNLASPRRFGPGGGDDGRNAELRALFEPPLRLCCGPQPARETDLAERGEARPDRRPLRSRCDGERDREIGARLVDADP